MVASHGTGRYPVWTGLLDLDLTSEVARTLRHFGIEKELRPDISRDSKHESHEFARAPRSSQLYYSRLLLLPHFIFYYNLIIICLEIAID